MQHARMDYNARIQDSAGIIPEDEPVFLIRARDMCAVPAMRAWLMSAQDASTDPAVIEAVWGHLNRMWKYACLHGGTKVPTTPEELLIKGGE